MAKTAPPIGTPIVRGHSLAAGLVGYWPMLEGGGNEIHDYSGCGCAGVLTNMDPATDWVPNHSGMVLDFDGVDDYVNAPTLHDFAPGDDLSASLWFKINTFPAADSSEVLISKSAATNRDVSLQIRNTSGVVTIRAWVANNTGAPLNGATTLVTGKWYHFALRFNNAANRTQLFLNGVRDATTAAHSGDFGTSNPGMDIGRWIEAGTLQFDGQIGNILLYNRLLTVLEIRQLYLDPWLLFSRRRRTILDAAPPSAEQSILTLTGVGV